MNQIIEEIIKAQRIVILGHVRPDGDCVGSSMGFYNYILDNYPEKTCHVYLGEFDQSFGFLRGIDKVRHEYDEQETYDLCLAVDCASMDRMGDFLPYFHGAKRKALVDHHASNTGFGDVYVVKADASAACEVIYGLLQRDRISKYCGEALYLGIVHDTGVFKHGNTTKSTMEIAGDLIALGAEPSKIIDGTFYSKSYVQNQILGVALVESYLALDTKCIVTCLDYDVFQFYHATSVDVDGVVDQIRVTRGIEVAVFYYEFEPNTFKFSLRSNSYVDVSKIAVHFGGGGHIHAAGFTLEGNKGNTIERVLQQINLQLS